MFINLRAHALTAAGLLLGRHDGIARAALVREVQAYMLDSDEHWESIWEHRTLIANSFNSSKKGRKGDVLNAFEQQADRAGKRAYYPSLLQIVFRSGSRVHALVNRYSRFLCFYCLSANAENLQFSDGFMPCWILCAFI